MLGLRDWAIQLKEQGNDEIEVLQNELSEIEKLLHDSNREYNILIAVDRDSNSRSMMKTI